MLESAPDSPAGRGAAGSLPAGLPQGEVPAFRVDYWAGRRHPWCVVVPVINEGERIRSLVERMRAASIDALADIVIVDGGSTDGSLEPDWLRARGVAGLLVKTGPGRLSAQLRCGYAFALAHGYAGIVTIDGNNKDDPDAIPRMIQALGAGFDFVQASRYLPGGAAENTPLLRTLAIRLIHAPLLRLFSGFRWTDTTQGFRAYGRAMLLDPRVAPFRDCFDTYELLAYLSYRVPRLGYRCVEIASRRSYPRSGAVPTKIGGLRGNLGILAILVKACLGRYDP
ncbi:MAG: glycosyltransferase family 2 protein [Delftia acidovorans]|nr:glycosyltransferase family 2 protein [Delftia acidovorans]